MALLLVARIPDSATSPDPAPLSLCVMEKDVAGDPHGAPRQGAGAAEVEDDEGVGGASDGGGVAAEEQGGGARAPCG